LFERFTRQSSIVSVYVNSDRLREAAEVAEETCPGGKCHFFLGKNGNFSGNSMVIQW
jgi:hypothetical protein